MSVKLIVAAVLTAAITATGTTFAVKASARRTEALDPLHQANDRLGQAEPKVILILTTQIRPGLCESSSSQHLVRYACPGGYASPVPSWVVRALGG